MKRTAIFVFALMMAYFCYSVYFSFVSYIRFKHVYSPYKLFLISI